MDKEGIKYQLVPPHNHRRNAAERAVRTSKNHLLAGWASFDPDYPMRIWNETMEHAELSLNLLRGSRINPKLSAWEQINGRYDFNKTPIAPPGTKVLAHLKPTTQRKSWDMHAIDAWYTGPAMESYRCHKVWNPKTRKQRIVDTLTWCPTKVAMPIATQGDLLRAAVSDIAIALKKPSQPNTIGWHPSTFRSRDPT